VAKKNTDGTTPAPRRATTPKRSASKKAPASEPVEMASVTRAEPVDSAADAASGSAGADSARATTYQPSYDDIAQAAYERYLRRGGSDGRDFDDWIEAERELTRRNGH
jgi:Protein of unknown function (DUF2934)